MKIKICGITDRNDALVAADAGADFVGLILAPSARNVAPDVAKAVVNDLHGRSTQPVLLFRDAPLRELLNTINAVGGPTTGAIDPASDYAADAWIQLHGDEPADYIAALRAARPDCRIIKAWEIGPPDSEARLMEFVLAAEVDVVLLDAPKGGPHPGYDRLSALSHQWRAGCPSLWCAGGLTPANVAGVIRAGCFAGVDVARGVEAAPGKKDHSLMRAFISAVRSAAGEQS